MRFRCVRARYALVVMCSFLTAAPAPAQVVNILHTFNGGANDGQNPSGQLTPFGSTFFGMTSVGGLFGDGTVFRVNLDGSGFTLLHSFSGNLADGRNGTGSLALAGSAFYGMNQFGGNGGNGTLFRMNTDGTGYVLVHSFFGGSTDGSGPLGSPVVSGPTIYGMTMQGGTANFGTVFKVNIDGTGFNVVHSFTGAPGDGHFPAYSSLVVSGSTIYGMTAEGGTADQGAIFRMNTDGTGFTLLHSFTPSTGDGATPYGSLTLFGNTLFGMTRQAGGNAGTIFKIITDGSGYNQMHTFGGAGDGANPTGDLLVVGSELFGMTHGGGADALGALFGINMDGTGYNVRYSFTGGPNDGASPFGGFILSDSTLYGMTVNGGSSDDGVIFSTPIPEPSSLLLLSAAASAVAWAICRRRAAC